jgi:DNA repair protein SbcC/Rad50
MEWRDVVRELDRFHLAWRKLGPVKHTVPNRTRPALEQRLQLAVARVETPLQHVRSGAVSAREALITAAEALLPEHPGRPPGKPLADAARQVRDLQAIWQEQARELQLPRGLENALWTRFKAATDAVFAQRQAAFAARDDELQANVTVREALLQRLEALGSDTPEVDLQRTLDDVDRAWRQAGEVPRAMADRMEQRLRSAHAAAVQWLGSSARRQWLAQLDALSARLALCEAKEGGTSQDDLSASWNRLGALPASWEQALSERWTSGAQPGPLAAAEVDDLLLQLETALDLPTPAEWQAARRALKLRALKDSMEGRIAAASGPARHAAWFQSSLRQAGLSAGQRERLKAILTALREAQPGALTTTA